MSEQNQIVKTEFVAIDKASAPVNRIAGVAGKLTSMFDQASHSIASFGPVAGIALGAFGFKNLVSDAAEHLKSVKRLAQATGMATSEAEGLQEMFGLAKIEGFESERILMSLSKKSMLFESKMASMRGVMSPQIMMFRELGIDIDKGPVAAIVKLSEQAKSGKLSQTELGMALGMNTRVTGDFYEMLQKGPDALKEQVAGAQKYGIATANNMNVLARYSKGSREISDAWEKIKLNLGASLMPLAAELLKNGAKKLESWVDTAKEFGSIMSDFLRNHLDLVINIGKVLMANALLMKITSIEALGGKSTGIFGSLGRLGAWAFPGKTAGVAPKLGSQVSGFLNQPVDGWFKKLFKSSTGQPGAIFPSTPWSAAGMAAAKVAPKRFDFWSPANLPKVTRFDPWAPTLKDKIFGGLKAAPGMAFGGIKTVSVGAINGAGKIATGFIDGLMKIGPMLWGITKIGVVGAAIYLIYKGFQGITENINGIRTVMLDLIDRMGIYLAPISLMFADGTPTSDFFKSVLPTAMEFVLWMVERIMFYAKVVGGFFGAAFGDMPRLIKVGPKQVFEEVMAQTQMDVDQELEKMRARKKAADDLVNKNKTPDDRAQTNFNFHNARFNITQKFAEGFDPDRIAVTFAKDISRLSERRIQSGFAPAGSL